MTKKLLTIAALAASLFTTKLDAQVRDVSVTVSPFAEYNWWNKNIALKNAPFWGARVGFGFGPFFELRGTFEKSLDLRNALEGKKWNPLNQKILAKLEGMDTEITRIGGEAKINLFGSYGFSPYITAGTGVQIFDYTPFGTGNLSEAISTAKVKEQQIYLSLGAGIKLSLSDRIALSLEARNISFNLDENNSYLNPTLDNKGQRFQNWAGIASLDFYLGGNSTAAKDRYGRAYRALFSDGFRGPKLVVEPGIAYIDFNKKLPHDDQWFVGGSAGIDLSSLIGVRAFYYQATTDPQKLNLDLKGDLKMYGANIIARLNYPRGIVPYLSLGAGYLEGNEGTPFHRNNLFAMAGAGIEIPVSRYIALFGTYNAMLNTNRTETDAITQAQTPSQLLKSDLFTSGVRFNLGVSASAPVYEATAFDTKSTNDRVNELHAAESAATATAKTSAQAASSTMTKEEFEAMVDRILERIRKEEKLVEARLKENETAVILAALTAERKETPQKEVSEINAETMRLLQEVSAKLDRQTVAPAQTAVPMAALTPASITDNGSTVGVHPSMLSLNRLAIFAGGNVGDAFQANLGFRGYLQISNTNFDFVPEVFVGLASKTGYGASANVIYNFKHSFFNNMLTPYAGLGLGFFKHGDTKRSGINYIVGTDINAWGKGAFFADLTVRGAFANNQLAVGYRFVF